MPRKVQERPFLPAKACTEQHHCSAAVDQFGELE